MGLLLLSCALEVDPEVFAPHYKDLLRLFHQTLNNRGQPAILYYSLRSLTILAAGLGSDEMVGGKTRTHAHRPVPRAAFLEGQRTRFCCLHPGLYCLFESRLLVAAIAKVQGNFS